MQISITKVGIIQVSIQEGTFRLAFFRLALSSLPQPEWNHSGRHYSGWHQSVLPHPLRNLPGDITQVVTSLAPIRLHHSVGITQVRPLG